MNEIINKAAFVLDESCAELDRVVDLLDAATTLLAPLIEGRATPQQIEHIYRISDACLDSARRRVIEAADDARAATEKIMDSAS